MNPHIGSDFNDFLAEQGFSEEASAAALKRVTAWQFSKKASVEFMHTSRSALSRTLDKDDQEMALATLASVDDKT